MRAKIINKKNIINVSWIIFYVIILPFIISILMNLIYVLLISYADMVNNDNNGPYGIYKIKPVNEMYTVLHLKSIIFLITASTLLIILSILYKKRFLLFFIDIFMSFVITNTTDFIMDYTNEIIVFYSSFITLSIISILTFVFTKKIEPINNNTILTSSPHLSDIDSQTHSNNSD